MLPVAVNTVDVVDGSGTLNDSVQNFVFIGGKLVTVVGWRGNSHPPCPIPEIHCQNKWNITAGSPVSFIKMGAAAIPIARRTDPSSCGHSITTGSDFVNSD